MVTSTLTSTSCRLHKNKLFQLQLTKLCFSSSLPSVAEHLIAQHSAIKMLHSRVKIILEYVKAVEAGERTSVPL